MAAKTVRLSPVIGRALRLLRREISIESAVLFGSRATGLANRWSDFDLAVFSPTVEGWTVEDKVRLISLAKKASPLIELHLFSDRALREARPTNFYGHILSTGIKVS